MTTIVGKVRVDRNLVIVTVTVDGHLHEVGTMHDDNPWGMCQTLGSPANADRDAEAKEAARLWSAENPAEFAKLLAEAKAWKKPASEE